MAGQLRAATWRDNQSILSQLNTLMVDQNSNMVETVGGFPGGVPPQQEASRSVRFETIHLLERENEEVKKR